MGLKAELYSLIKARNGEVFTYEEFEVICRRRGRRVSNGERRMRELTHCLNPEIDIVRSSKGHITGWFLKVPSYPYQAKLGFMR